MTQQQETMILQLRDEIVYRQRELDGLKSAMLELLQKAGLSNEFKLRVEPLVSTNEAVTKEN